MNRLAGLAAVLLAFTVVYASDPKAVDFNRKGGAAFKRGDYKAALSYYEKALRVNRSVEDFEGIATDLFNLAVVYRKLGERENAIKSIDEVLGMPKAHGEMSGIRSGAAYLKAMVYLDSGDYGLSEEWAGKALSFCRGDCPSEGRVFNLRARLALKNGDPATALTLGLKGLEANRKQGDPLEEANSLRIIADAKLASGDYPGAVDHYESALALDKALGLSGKIALDLTGLGNAYEGQGMPDKAAGYFRRARSVGEAAPSL